MPRVLVVDDFADTREMLTTVFESAGYEVIAAGDGMEGLQKARDHQPAVIIMDLYMPRMDGVEATRRIKATAELSAVPVIAYTARPGPVDDHLFAAMCEKPCPPDVLLEMVADAAAGRSIKNPRRQRYGR